MDSHQQENLNQDEEVSLMKLAGQDAIRAILTEDARVQSLPIIQKASLLSDTILSFTESLGSTSAENQYKQILLDASYDICNKIVVAENSRFFNDKMEQALLVKIAVKKVLNQLDGLEVLGLCDLNYAQLIKNEIEQFRQLFNSWVNTFDKNTRLSDGWDLPLNS